MFYQQKCKSLIHYLFCRYKHRKSCFSGSQFYLVLDVTNLTLQEMTLNYTESKTILIEAKESCRIPVPVERCDLERILVEHSEMNEDQMSKK